jgi:DNA-binding beta-propeller fold protein YncE
LGQKVRLYSLFPLTIIVFSSFDEKTNVFDKNLDVISNATITVIDPSTGELIGEYGRGLFYMPHGLSLDPEGNYWITDVARHQVFKLDANFKPLLGRVRISIEFMNIKCF